MSRKLPLLLAVAVTGLPVAVAVAAPPAASPYFTDPQSSHVQDATSDSIGQVNMIACIMHAMRPDALVNQPAYIALVDQNQCNSAKQASSGNSSGGSGSQAPDYMTAIVESTRASNSDPMIVKAWISIDDGNGPATVWAHISATAAPTSSDPYGSFRLDYCGLPDAPGSTSCAMNGFMQAGSGTLSYYEIDGGGGGFQQTTALQLSSVGTSSGSGSLSFQQSGGGGSQSTAFDFAYNATNYLRTDNGGSSVCFSRDATDPATGLSVWSYGLYDSGTGERIDLNSGFPIQYTVSGTTYQGYLGFYGLSVQSGAPAPADGSTVQEVKYSNNASTTTSFTIVQNSGRLMRFTRKTRTLKEIDQIPFMTWVSQTGTSGLPNPNTSYVLNWDDASSMFIVTGEVMCGQNGCSTTNLPTPISVDPSFWQPLGGVQGSSQSLGGDLFVDLSGLSGTINSTTTTVVYHVQDMVYPDDTNKPAQLYCINNCPSAASLQAYFTQTSASPVTSPFIGATYNQFQPVMASGLVSYTVDSRGQLTDSAPAAVVYTDATAFAQYPQYQSGVTSGRLFVNQTDATCNTTQFCDYAVNSAAVFYQWQTGPNSWDQFTAVKDSSGNYVHFDAPLQVNFTVPANASGNAPYGTYAGTSLVLQYGGFGNLWGIPGSCFSSTTNQPVDCSTQGARYVSDFAIPYDPTANPQKGVVTTTSNNVTTTYLVKWLDREIRFAQKSLSVCTGQGLQTTTATLPAASGLKDPSNSTSDVYLGTKPTVTDAPRVIQGQVMY